MNFNFGKHQLKVAERQLFDADGALSLDGRTVDVLRVLLERPNELVSKREMFAAVWPGMAVGENALHVHVSALRKALGPDVIETVHGRGYIYRGPQPERIPPGNSVPFSGAGRPVVAVLPLASPEAELELTHFGEALAQELTEQLSRFSLLSVIYHARRNVPPNGNAGEGGAPDSPRADFLLMGEVRRFAGRTRIAARLQDGQSGVVVWAEHYDRQSGDNFGVQDELGGLMAGRIGTRIETHMATRPVPGRALTSYDHLARGIWHFRSRSRDGEAIAEQMFRKARELDAGNAEAVRWLSLRMTCLWLERRGREHLAEGLALGRAAAELDPSSAGCHAAYGLAQLWAEGLEEAAHSFRKAYAANPNDGYMLADVALSHIYGGKFAEACAVLERAEQLNAFPSDWHSQYRGIGHFAEQRYAEAVPGLRRRPLGAHSALYLMACHGHLGNRQEIAALLPRVRENGWDLAAAAEDEPFRDPAIRAHLSDGIGKAMQAAV